jgi:pyridoxal-dependent decarboxylase-like protein
MVTDRLFDVLPRTAAAGTDGRLTVGGCALADVAEAFGTPTFVVDEHGLRETAREYLDAFSSRHPGTEVHFASKALPCAPVLRLLADEGLGCDVASAGELAIALAAGFDPTHVLLHGNAKSDLDIADALAAGVGMIVIDGPDDVDRLQRLAPARQAVLLRVNPSVPGRTHAAMDTGSPEAKFGVALDDAPALLQRIAAVPGLELLGLHVHIGSQLLDLEGFDRAAATMTKTAVPPARPPIIRGRHARPSGDPFASLPLPRCERARPWPWSNHSQWTSSGSAGRHCCSSPERRSLRASSDASDLSGRQGLGRARHGVFEGRHRRGRAARGDLRHIGAMG